jgi:cytochrome P450
MAGSRDVGGESIEFDAWHGANPLDPSFRSNPHPFLKHLREVDPVNQTPAGLWRLCRYDDCVRLLTRVATGVRTADGVFPAEGIFPEGRAEFLLQQDPPNHTRLRKLVSKAFSPRAIARLQTKVQLFSEELIDRVAGCGEMDVIADLALPVPSLAICEMMGVPFSDREQFTVWTAEATQLLAALVWAPEMAERGLAAAEKLHRYFKDLIDERRRNLGDDILSELIRAEEFGDRLSQTELLAQCRGLLIAGFETTVGLIGNGMLALLSNPNELALLESAPNLIDSAIEECLRYDGPLVLTQRYLREDATFGGKLIPEGAQVWAMLSAANRDPARFEDPDRFDIRRKANEHLAFGGGSHFCLGAHLARMETRIAMGTLFGKLYRFEMATDQLEWGRSLFRVLSRLPVRFDTRVRAGEH